MSASAPLLRTHGRRLVQMALLALSFVLAVAVLPSGTASAAAAPVVQCSSVLNQGGQVVECTVTVVNTLDAATGIGSSVVTVQQCTGAVGAPTCAAPVTSSFPDVVTSVSQCNGSASGGGGAATCTVNITNDVTGGATPTPATVNQCIGSGDGSGTVICSPVGATTGATVTQCNGSGNGGGSTVRCTVAAGSTQSASLQVMVDQCNGSANGGGALVTCRTSITNNVLIAQAPAPSTSPTATAGPTTSATPAPSASPSASTTPSATPATSGSPSASPAAVTTPTPPVPVVAPDSDVLPEVLQPVAAPPVAEQPVVTVSVPVDGSLPTTGTDAGVLLLLGLLATGSGGVLLLVGRPPRGRHVLR